MEDVLKCRLLTVKQVALMLNIAKSTVYAYAQSGQLKPLYLPNVRPSTAVRRNRGAIRFKLEDVDQFYDDIGSR